MKNLFSYDRTDDEYDLHMDENPYITARLSEDTVQKIQKVYDEMDAEEDKLSEQEDQALHPKIDPRLWIGLGLLVLAILPVLILREAVFQGNGIWIAVGELVLLIASAVLIRIAERKQRKSLEEASHGKLGDNLDATLNRLNELSALADAELAIPEDALYVDVLPFVYKRKGEVRKSCLSGNRFDNQSTRIWRRGWDLCLSDSHVVLTVPQDAIRGRITYAKPYTIELWLKDTKYDEGQYKPYHIRSAGLLACRAHTYYGIVIGQEGGEDYELLIPGYDWPQIEKLISIPELDALPRDDA